MNRTEVNSTAEAVMRIIERHKDEEPSLVGFDINRGGGKFGSGYFDMKLSITPKTTAADRQRIASTSNDEVVRRGLATAGTPVVCYIKGGDEQRGTIVKANRTRYVIKGVGGKYDGKEFTYPFHGMRLDKTAAA